MRGSRAWAIGLLLVTLPLAACAKQTPEATGLPAETGPAGPGAGGLTRVDPASVPEADYARMVDAFYGGVTAMQVGDAERALQQLSQATGIVPGEPAAWADLALAEMRAGDLAAAAEPMAKARALAPESAAVTLMAGMLAQRNGDLTGGEALIREAIALEPEFWRARYALYDALKQSPEQDEAGRAEMRLQLTEIGAGQPDNLVPQLELAQLAVEDEDLAGLASALTALEGLAAGWDEPARAQLELARGLAVDTADPRERKVAVVTLRNLLLSGDGFREGIAALQSDFGDVVPPIERFLALETPSAEPAEAALDLRFEVEPIDAPGASWAKAAHLQADGPPSLLLGYADRLELRAAAGEPVLLAETPGGVGAAGVLPVDWDNDQRVDLVLAGEGGLRLYQQGEDGGFEDRSGASGLDGQVLVGNYTGAWAFDLDMEGDLDLLLGAAEGPPTLLRNNGDGSWTREDREAFGALNGLFDLVWADLDGDGDGDLGLVDAAGIWLARNDRALGYTLVALEAAPEASDAPLGAPTTPATVEPGRPPRIGLADVDRDGRLELTTSAGYGFELADGRSAEREPVAGAPDLDGDAFWADLDNNGALDLVGGGYVGLGGGPELVALADAPLGDLHAALDLDGDGWIDLVGEDATGRPSLWRNAGVAAGYGWQVLRPRAVTQGDQRNNSFGVGGEVEMRAGLLYQKLPIEGPVVHLGLGDRPGPSVLRIRWPNGSAQAEFDVAKEQVLVADQRLKGSCPWLFAWDGERMTFVTDVLWRSPLGLRINAQDTAGVVQTRDWVLVRGEQLQPKDGVYDLRVTAELWETHFFDEVKLLVADHPAGTLAWVDERFSFPPPPLAVQLTGPVAPVARALDREGRDISELLAQRDGIHFEGIGRGAYQGLAGDHWTTVELDPEQPLDGPEGPITLSEALSEGSLRLIAQGWIYPTDSSINVAISQGRIGAPSDLALEVMDASGAWRPLRAGLGFPAGKRKSLLIDLADAFDPDMPGPWRLRLRTSMEIYWDALQVARALPDDVTLVALAPDQAELRYRGFSVTNRIDGSAGVTQPEIPDYDRLLTTAPIWLDLEGFYTRFGDIRELLTETDDRYAILNAGDEMAFAFAAPEAPAEGWVRDFVFLSDGWVKDGDFNTSYSETLRPLPAHDKPEYTVPGASGPLAPLSEDPIYRRHPEDWQRWHTRYVSPRPNRDALIPSTD
ncbi:MAG: VCBS repeat-containing protein [Chloroflexi bacterium]|nr:VCBS repeat-containing protein [Chloroflexota bacterium]